MQPIEAKTHLMNKFGIAASDYSNMLYAFNFRMYDICGAIAIKNEHYFGYRYMDAHLEASTRIYEIPQDILNRVSGIEVQIDGANWQPVTIKKMTDIKDFVYDETWITNNYSSEKPHGFFYGKYFYLLSGAIAAVTRGLRYFYKALPSDVPTMDGTTDLSITTDPAGTLALGIPKQFHKLWVEGLEIDYKNENEIPLTREELLWEERLKDKVDNELVPTHEDEEVQASIPDDDGSNY